MRESFVFKDVFIEFQKRIKFNWMKNEKFINFNFFSLLFFDLITRKSRKWECGIGENMSLPFKFIRAGYFADNSETSKGIIYLLRDLWEFCMTSI